MPPLVTAAEYLEINSHPTATPAYRFVNLDALSHGAPLVGRNERMPGATGRRAFRRYMDEIEFTLLMVVNGAFADDGTANSNPRQGWRDHLLFLGSAFGQASASNESQVTANWHQFDGDVYTTSVQVAGPYGIRRVGPYVKLTTFDITVPSAVWTLVP